MYAVEPTKGRPVRIQVSLSSTNPSVAFIEVRVRRHVHKRAVNFTNGKSGFVVFELIDPPAARGRACGVFPLPRAYWPDPNLAPTIATAPRAKSEPTTSRSDCQAKIAQSTDSAASKARSSG